MEALGKQAPSERPGPSLPAAKGCARDLANQIERGGHMEEVFGWVPVGGTFKFCGDSRIWRVEADGSAVTDGGVRIEKVHSCTPVEVVDSAKGDTCGDAH